MSYTHHNAHHADEVFMLENSVAHGLNGDYQTSLAICDEIIDRDPYYALAYSVRGVTKFKLSMYAEAFEDFEAALMLDPTLAHAYCGRAATHGKFKQFDKAIADSNSALLLDDKYANAYVNRAAALTILENNQEALEDFNNALKYMQKAETYLARSRVLLKLERINLAIEDCLTAIEIEPSEPAAYFLLFDIFVHCGNFLKAIEVMSRLLNVHPNLALAYYQRAYAYDKLGCDEKVLIDLARAATLDSEYQMALEFARETLINEKKGIVLPERICLQAGVLQ